MIRWVVGDKPVKGTIVGKFADENSMHGLDKLAQPVTLTRSIKSGEIELEVGAENPRFRQGFKKNEPVGPKRQFEEEKWTIRDRDERTRFKGCPTGDNGTWFVLSEVVGSDGMTEYHVNVVDRWVKFDPVTTAQEMAPDLETSEKMMKELKIKAKNEFNEYLKLKGRRAEEIGVGVMKKDDYIEEDEKKASLKRRKLVLKKMRGGDRDDDDVADSAVAYQEVDRDAEGEWEGEEAFSDDDDQMFLDEVNDKEELDIEVEDGDVERDGEEMVEEDALFKDTFGDEISKIMSEENEKKVGEDDLDDELKKFGDLDVEDDDEEEAGEVKTVVAAKPAVQEAPVMVVRKTTKEDQIRARVKGMFWRNEYKLKLKDVLSQFPGLNRASEDYQYLTKSLKDLAEVKDGVLHLKPQYRK